MYKDTLKKIYEEALISYKYDESYIPDEIKEKFEEALSKGRKHILISFEEFNDLRLSNNNLDFILISNGISICAKEDGMHLSVEF